MWKSKKKKKIVLLLDEREVCDQNEVIDGSKDIIKKVI